MSILVLLLRLYPNRDSDLELPRPPVTESIHTAELVLSTEVQDRSCFREKSTHCLCTSERPEDQGELPGGLTRSYGTAMDCPENGRVDLQVSRCVIPIGSSGCLAVVPLELSLSDFADDLVTKDGNPQESPARQASACSDPYGAEPGEGRVALTGALRESQGAR